MWDQVYLDNVVYAEEILRKIVQGADIYIHDSNIIGNIDTNILYINNKIKKINSNIVIKKSNIHGEVRFTNVILNGSIKITETKLWNTIDFSNTTFKGVSNFQGSKFRGKAVFLETIFEGDADFSGADFFEITSFQSSIFKQDATFESTKFRSIAIFDFVCYRDSVFDYARFCKIAHFRSGDFKGSTRFQNICCALDAYFNDSNFARDVSFEGAKFLSSMDFRNVKIQNYADFKNVSISNKFNLDRCSINLLNVCWDDIKNHIFENDYVYKILKKNFRELNRPHDEDECYIQYRQWLLKTRPHDPLWFIDKAADLSCGYGYKPLKLLRISILLIVIFSIPYYLLGFKDIDYEFTFINSYRSFGFSFGPMGECPRNIYSSLYFSAMTFLGKKASSLEPPHILWGLVLLETALGYVALGILISSLYRIFTRGSDR